MEPRTNDNVRKGCQLREEGCVRSSVTPKADAPRHCHRKEITGASRSCAVTREEEP